MNNACGNLKVIAILGMILSCFIWVHPAEATRRFTSQELNAPQPVEVTMGDPAGTALTYRITNTSTAGDINRGIYRLIFTAPTGYSFTGAPVLPTGWAISGTPGQSITLLTSNAAPCTNCIFTATAGGTAKDYTLSLGAIPAGTQDGASTISVQARFNNNRNTTNSGQTFVTRRSLKAALVAYLPSQCTPDCTNWGATCQATPSVGIGSQHSLALIVRNNSTSTWTGIISSPNPPTALYTWAGGGPAFNAPAAITLASNACGVVTWTATMPAGRSGTVYYQAQARNSTGAATSVRATSNTVIVSSLAAAIGQTCVFPGEVSTVTTTVTNNGAVNITNVRPWGISTTLNGNHNSAVTTINVASTAGFPTAAGTLRIDSEEIDYAGTTAASFTGCTRGAHGTTAASHNNNTLVFGPRPVFVGTAPAPTYLTGPVPASLANLAAGASNIFTWTYRINGTNGQNYSFQAFASQQGGLASPFAGSTASTLGYYDVTIGGGGTLGAGTANNGTFWNVTNRGCAPVNRVDIQIPGGFTVASSGFDSNIGDWSENYAGGSVSFTSGTDMAIGQSGIFSILFTGIPGTGLYPFPVSITDTAGRLVPNIPTNVNVDASTPGSGSNKAWEERVR
jgi:hypothetical protein